MIRKRIHRVLPEATLQVCPYADPACRLCQLGPEEVQLLNEKRFDEKIGHERIRQYIKSRHPISPDYGEITKHFNFHVLGKHTKQILTNKRGKNHPAIVSALQPLSDHIKLHTSEDLEKAYEALVRIAQSYVRKTTSLQDHIAIQIDARDQDGTLDKELEQVSSMELLEKQAKLNKEAREFVKEVGVLRAPKVMVAQFLESFIDDVIRELSNIINNLCGEIQFDVANELKEAGHPNVVSHQTFSNIFRKVAVDFRDRMINLKRQKMTDAIAALQNLEKII